MKLYQQYLGIAKSRYDVQKVKFDLGLISAQDLFEKEVAISRATFELSEVLYDYNRLIEQADDYLLYKIDSYR